MLDFDLQSKQECHVAEMMKRILVVDDEENARIALSKILTREGYDVASAGNGYEALNYLRDREVELIITDINMPEMNGMAFLRELNRSHPASNVIMITAYGEVESYIEAMNLGAFEYINKPVKLEELNKIIRKIFALTSQAHHKETRHEAV
jgi:two-component system response regulator (stage 0 sporulation protein F)